MATETEKHPIIECDNLVKIYKTKDIEVLALQGLELQIDKGELMAIVGNSGSGKSTFLNMIGGLDRPSAGRLIVDGKDLFKLSEKELVEYKRSTVGFVWQNNARNLLPYMTALQNVQVPMMFDSNHKKEQRALELLELVGMSHRKHSKLRQLSGGEQQRIAIAIALANNPKILLADEPTTALDVTIQAQILDLLKEIQTKLGTATILVSHDLGVVARCADRVAIMYAGKIVEIGTAEEVYYDPRHPYTWGLMQSLPAFNKGAKELKTIPGMPPTLIDPPVGDAFACRNRYALEIDYHEQPPMFRITDTHYAATWLLDPRAPKVESPMGGKRNV